MADKYVKLDDVLEIVRIVMTNKRITHKYRSLNRNLKQLDRYEGFVFPPKENLWTIPADPEPYIHRLLQMNLLFQIAAKGALTILLMEAPVSVTVPFLI